MTASSPSRLPAYFDVFKAERELVDSVIDQTLSSKQLEFVFPSSLSPQSKEGIMEKIALLVNEPGAFSDGPYLVLLAPYAIERYIWPHKEDLIPENPDFFEAKDKNPFYTSNGFLFLIAPKNNIIQAQLGSLVPEISIKAAAINHLHNDRQDQAQLAFPLRVGGFFWRLFGLTNTLHSIQDMDKIKDYVLKNCPVQSSKVNEALNTLELLFKSFLEKEKLEKSIPLQSENSSNLANQKEVFINKI